MMHTVPEVQKLRNAVECMDCLSQGGFSEIASIAKLALSSLETPDGYRHLDNIANALKAIWGKADDTQNCINCEAEQVGCNYTDDDKRRRWAAFRQVREAGVVDVVEDVRLKESEPVLLLAGASALDTNHPLHAEEVGFAAQAWEIAIRTEAPLPGKTVKQTIRHILDTYPQFSHLSNDAKTRVSQSANYDRKGGVPRTPQKIEPTHSQ